MKVICEGLDLSVAANTVLRGVSNKLINPILECIKIVAKNNTLLLSTTDLEIYMEKKINADVKIEGEVIIPAKLFCEYLRKISEGQVLIWQEGNKLKIKTGDSDCEFSCLNISEFPNIIKVTDSNTKIQIETKELKNIIGKSLCCVLQDDSRPVLKGVLFNIEKDILNTASLDGFRLCTIQTKIKNLTDNQTVKIIPARALDEISKILTDENTNNILEFNKNFIQVIANGVSIVSRLIEGEFINYKQIVPPNYETNVVVNKKNLEQALERASLLARVDRNNLVNFKIKDGIITIKSNNEKGLIEEKVACELKGKDLEIAFNVKYFSDALRNIADEFIKINFNSSITPCTITSVANGNFLFLILPVRVI
ncbi:MAG: DNA polymerase III subunit beta [Firmicutes bacterium]|nr:DNA polymerase III subunit beta [Bacillota bacterium]